LPTALIFPVVEACRRVRPAGILTVIDGTHTPDQISQQGQSPLQPVSYHLTLWGYLIGRNDGSHN